MTDDEFNELLGIHYGSGAASRRRRLEFIDPFLERNLRVELELFARRNVHLFERRGCQEVEGIGLIWTGSGTTLERYLGPKRVGGYLHLGDTPDGMLLQAFSYLAKTSPGGEALPLRVKLHHFRSPADHEALTILLFRLMALNARCVGQPRSYSDER